MCNCPVCTQDNLPSTESTGQIVESAIEASRFPGTWAEWKDRIRRKRRECGATSQTYPPSQQDEPA